MAIDESEIRKGKGWYEKPLIITTVNTALQYYIQAPLNFTFIK